MKERAGKVLCEERLLIPSNFQNSIEHAIEILLKKKKEYKVCVEIYTLKNQRVKITQFEKAHFIEAKIN